VLLGWTGIGFSSAAPLESLDDVAEALCATLPSVDNHDERAQILKALDGFLEQPNSERSPKVALYYQGMVDRALDEIETLEVTEGVAIWKLYSSSFVIKTPQITFAGDLDEGPNKDSGNPDRRSGLDGITFHMTPQQRARLAKLVDVSFHTHRHHDHVNYPITQELVKAGKTVIVPPDIRKMWENEPFADGLTTIGESPEMTRRFGPLQVQVLASRQWMAVDHTSACPCNAYLVTTDNGVSILFKGDINDGKDILPWLQGLKAREQTIDLYIGHVSFWWGDDALMPITRLFDPFIIPGHEYEFTHRKRGEPGSGTGSYTSRIARFRAPLGRGKGIVLSWGERFDYMPKLHRKAKSPLIWVELDPRPRAVRVCSGDEFTVDFQATASGTAITRWYLAFKSTDTLKNLPGFDDREWGGIIHDPDGDGVFRVSTTGWTPGAYRIDCTVDDWPGGNTRSTIPIAVTVLADE